MHGDISRRDLIKAAVAAGLTVVGAAGCNSSGSENEGGKMGGGPGGAASGGVAAQANPDGTATVAGGGKLANGAAMLVTLPDQRPALLFKTKDGKVLALSALCTHQQCSVTWEAGSEKLKCPCHGSLFDTTGKPLQGPATVPLAKYPVTVKGEDALLQLKSS